MPPSRHRTEIHPSKREEHTCETFRCMVLDTLFPSTSLSLSLSLCALRKSTKGTNKWIRRSNETRLPSSLTSFPSCSLISSPTPSYCKSRVRRSTNRKHFHSLIENPHPHPRKRDETKRNERKKKKTCSCVAVWAKRKRKVL